MFLSAIWTHSDGTYSLQGICLVSNWFNAFLIKKQTHLHFGWPEGKHIFLIFLFCFQWDSSHELLTSACQPNRRSMNPCPVYERESKTLFLFFITVPVGVSEHKQIHKNKNEARLCYITSKDTGKTWSDISDLTADVIGEQEKDWATFAVGPGHGIQMRAEDWLSQHMCILATHSNVTPHHVHSHSTVMIKEVLGI